MSTYEFDKFEAVTAVIVLTDPSTGEQYADPLVIGHYGPNGGGEIWIEQGGHRVQFASARLTEVIKQQKRASKMAQEASEA